MGSKRERLMLDTLRLLHAAGDLAQRVADVCAVEASDSPYIDEAALKNRLDAIVGRARAVRERADELRGQVRDVLTIEESESN